MKSSTLFFFAALLGAVEGFSTPASLASPKTCLYSTATADDETIPTNLPSECGMDYVPLATMLATEQFEEADQVREYTEYTVYRNEFSKMECQQQIITFRSIIHLRVFDSCTLTSPLSPIVCLKITIANGFVFY